MEQRDNMICIVGPTASGKTALSVRLAQALGGEPFRGQAELRLRIGVVAPEAAVIDQNGQEKQREQFFALLFLEGMPVFCDFQTAF